MSKQFSNKQVKFCKICKDAGKTEAEYTSHFIRETPDITSKVVCPTLLSQECRYCFKKGHTVKYCDIAKNKNKSKTEFHAPPRAVIQKKPTNKYANLESDEEDEVEKAPEELLTLVVEQFPALTNSVVRIQPVLKNYAAALASIPEPKPVATMELKKSNAKAKEEPELKSSLKAAPWAESHAVKRQTIVNWAMMEESDDEYAESVCECDECEGKADWNEEFTW